MTSCTPVKLAFNSVEPKEGASDKSPIIFCHGLTGSKENWELYGIPKIVADATKRKVYVIDARNHGDTEWSDVFNFDSNVDDLLHFMDTIGTRTATVVGHSMGGITAMRTALRIPDRIDSIVIEDISCCPIPQQVYDMINMYFRLGTAAMDQLPAGADKEEAKKLMFNLLFESATPDMRAVLRKESTDHNVIQFKRMEDGRLTFNCNMKVITDAVKNPDRLLPEYKGLYEGPACFIYGTASPINVGSDEANIKKYFRKAELVAIENANHNVHGDNQKEFMAALLKFLSE